MNKNVVYIILICMFAYFIYRHYTKINKKINKKIVVFMVKEDTPMYKDGKRAELFAYEKWYEIDALSFPKGCIHFIECKRAELPKKALEWYNKGVRWFCGALTSTSSLILKPFMDNHKDCLLEVTFSTVPAVKHVDNIYRFLNNIDDTRQYRSWLMEHIIKKFTPDHLNLFIQDEDVWSIDLGKEFEKIATYKSFLTKEGKFKESDIEKIKKGKDDLIICLSLDWKSCLDQLFDAGVKGRSLYFADTIAYRHDMNEKQKEMIKTNNVFASTPYPLTDGIMYMAEKFDSYTIPPSISSLYFIFLDAMRWLLSDIKNPHTFVEKMGGKNGMHYFDNYGDQADIRVVMLKSVIDKYNNVEWKTLASSGFRQTFGHFFADHTVKEDKHDRYK